MKESSTVIKVDIDSKDKIHRAKLREAITMLRLKYIWMETVETKKGFHVRIGVERKIPDMELLAIQAILGSDWCREIFNYHRIKSGIFENESWNVLFKEKYSVTKSGAVRLKSREKKV